MTSRRDQALDQLRRAGFLDRQSDGYWATKPHQPQRSFGERTILDLIRSGNARITEYRGTYPRHAKHGKTRPARIEPTGESQCPPKTN